MKKVEVYIPSLSTAGAEKFVTDLAINIEKSDIDFSVVIVSDSKKTYFYKKLEENGVNIIDLSSENKINRFFNIYNHIKQARPDVVHGNVAALQYLIFPAVFLKIPKKFYTVHGDGKKLAKGIRKLIYSFAFKVLKFRPVAISRFVLDSLKEEYGLSEDKMSLIHNGVDLSLFKSPQGEKDRAEFNIISVGRLEKIKNYPLLLDSFELVSKKYPFARLEILGSGSQREELIKKAEELNISDRVKFTESVPDPQNYVSKADLYVSTSKTEGFSLTTLEALACGVPAVATASGGVSDIIDEGKSGFICPHNKDEIEDKISYLIENRDVLKKMGEYAAKSAEKFDISIMAANYKKLYLG